MKKFKRVLLFIFIIGFSVFFIALGTAYIYKDDIAGALILKFNKEHNGQLHFTNVEFDPLVHFPGISLKLDSVSLFENKKNEEPEPVFSAGQLYFAFDFIDLFKGKINITKIDILNAALNLEKFPDGSNNLEMAFKSTVPKDSTANQNSNEIYEEISESWFAKEISLNAEHIFFENISIKYHEPAEELTSYFDIKNLNASVTYDSEQINLQLNSSIEIVDYLLNKNVHFKHNQVRIKTDLTYGLVSQNLTIAPGQLWLNDMELKIEGVLNLGTTDLIDLSFDGNADDISFLKSILTDDAIQNIDEGDAYFDGKIVGPYRKKLPEITLHFGFKDIKMRMPGTEGFIEKANLEGYFSSGNKRDLSLAEFRIINLAAELPGGKILANIKVKNFVKPNVDLSVELSADITGMENFFKTSLVDSLHGNVKIDSHIKGLFNPELPESFIGISTSTIVLDSVSFTIPEIMTVDLLDGEIAMHSDSLLVKNVLFKTGKTDLGINGFVDNAIYLLFNQDKEITSGLKIIAPAYDFPQFFAYNPGIWKSFPYVFENIDLDVFVTTSTFKLLHASHTPEIEFDIKHLNATVVDFLAPFTITQGVFNMGDKEDALLLSFKDFQLEMAGAEIHTQLEYYANNADSSSMDVQLQMNKLNPGALINNQDKQKPSEFLNGILNGSVKLFLDLSKDNANFKMIDFFSPALNYTMAKDTFELNNFQIKGNNISYENGSNPLSTLSVKSKIILEELKVNTMNIHHAEMDLTALNGVFDVDLTKINLLDEEGKGHLILDPFAQNPTYQLSYSISQFDVESMTAHFMKDTLVSGKADFNTNLTMHGNNWDSTLSNLDGVINFYSKDLTVHGYDIDRLIAKVKKTQNFDLMDVGAILLAGPFGLAITKGSEYTSLFINRSDATSTIHEFKTDWTIKDGIMTSKDVALATLENRIAGEGNLNLLSDSIQFDVALLNKRGCAVMTQSLHGSLDHPKIDNLKVAQNFIQPVINLAKEPAKIFCKPFYTGTVAQPEKREEKED